MSYIFGKKSILDQIRHRKNELVCVHFLFSNQELIEICKTNGVPYQIENKNYFNQFPKKLNHQNVVGELKGTRQEGESLEDFLKKNSNSRQLILILDSIEDPFNFGAILRSADAFGVSAVIYKKNNQAQINEFVSKTSLGAVNNLKLFRVPNLVNTINLLKKYKFWIYASLLDKNASDVTKVKFDQKTCLIVGNENKGISDLVAKESDFKVMIPMYGKVQSLNVSVATGILLYQIVKSQHND